MKRPESKSLQTEPSMNLSQPTSGQPGRELGPLLRHWRGTRGKSQLDLSLDSGLSQRHLSFIECGRSAPSRQTLLDIAEALDIPLRERNTLLLAAGYAPIFSESTWNAPEMQSITKALERVLRQHEPFPAIVMDRYWNVLMTNDSAPRFFNCFVDMAARKGPRNVLHLIFDPKGIRPFIANWEDVAAGLFQRVTANRSGVWPMKKTKELLAIEQVFFAERPRVHALVLFWCCCAGGCKDCSGVPFSWRCEARLERAPTVTMRIPLRKRLVVNLEAPRAVTPELRE